MTRLSACYFCGVAMDEPLQEYPVVPTAQGSPDAEPPTVTLCPSCHAKLEDVLEVVKDTLEGNIESSHVGNNSDAAGVDDPSADPTGEPEAETEATESAVDDAEVREVTEEDDPAGGGATSDDAAGGRVTDDGATDDDATEDDATDDDAGTDTDADPAERAVVEGEHSISALEYNKVMRLLQNREFPVDREEIETVAANAYGLARSDCARVIDVAVDEGLIADVDGQLRKPENA